MEEAAHLPLLLLVDDQPANLHAMVEALRGEHRIKIATAGEVGLQLAQQFTPDLILLDVSMPGMDGHQVLAALRAEPTTQAIPVIFVTADGSEQGELRGLELGADDFVAKPIVLPVLRARIRNALQREALKRDMLRMGLERSEAELRRAQEQLQGAREELAQKAKLESLGQLVARFAHDIGNPIGNCMVTATAIDGSLRTFSERAQSGALSRSALNEFLQFGEQGVGVLVRNLQRARELLESFKQHALDEATSQHREIELAEWLQDLAYLLSPMFDGERHRLQIEAAPGLRLHTQPGPLGQVLVNLVSNALAHGFEGRERGTVWLRVRADPAGGVELEVEDDGIGMSAEVQQRAFEPFYTTKAGRGGTGLGLDIVHHTVEQLGASLVLDSERGRGSRFTLRFAPAITPGSTPDVV